MTIKQIQNEKDGNNIEAIIFNRIKRHVFMLYPFADVRVEIATIHNEKHYQDGVYIVLLSEDTNLVMRIPELYLVRMISQEFYNPFFEDTIREILKKYINIVEIDKKKRTSGATRPDNTLKTCIHIVFPNKKQSLLKRLLGGLGL